MTYLKKLYEWERDVNEIHILEYLGNEKEIEIPDQIENLPVTVIGTGAFAQKGLIDVILQKR